MLNQSSTLKISISGVRGIILTDINTEDIVSFTKAFSATISKGKIAVASDNRISGEALSKVVIGTLLLLGRDVIDIGILPTPTLKAFVKAKKLAGAIMISASHNPMEYNGFKFIKKDGFFFDDIDNQKWHSYLSKVKDITNTAMIYGTYSTAHIDAMDIHIQNAITHIIGDVTTFKKQKKTLKVAIDTLGATATEIIPKLLNSLNIKYISMYPDILYKFPRNPEPVESSLKKFGDFVKQNKCDVGFAFDPDADRLALIDENGKPLGEEFTLPLSALYLFQANKRKNASFVVNLSSSWLNHWVAQKYNITLIQSKVGEANVVSKMIQNKSILGGEGNGGVIDPNIISYGRDSIVGVCSIIALLKSRKESLSQIVAEFPKTYMKKMAFSTVGKQNFDLKLIAKQLEAKFPNYIPNWEDGYYLTDPLALPWVHIRSSNTEPVVRVIIEASNEKELNSILENIII